MKNLSNEDLLLEVQRRLALNEKTISEQQETLQKMKELNYKLEQSESLKGHFISNIKNEINNPLASILALSQNILRKPHGIEPSVIKSLQLIYNEAHALDFQLDNIMTAAEIEAGQATPQWVDANVSQIIDQILHSFSTIIDKKQLTIQLRGDEHVHFVTDRHYFKIISTNLISNAIKFSCDKGVVSILLAHTVDHLKLIIRDCGTGIRENDMQKVFDRFTQLDSGTVKKFQGHGLGLSVVKDLVELLDGAITVSSSDEGSVFTIVLPVKLSDDGISTAFENGTEVLFDQSF